MELWQHQRQTTGRGMSGARTVRGTTSKTPQLIFPALNTAEREILKPPSGCSKTCTAEQPCHSWYGDRHFSVNSTPHRAHFAHAIISRVWLKIDSQTQCEANHIPLNNFLFVILAHHVSFALVMVGSSTFPSSSTALLCLYFVHHKLMNTHLIHGQ